VKTLQAENLTNLEISGQSQQTPQTASSAGCSAWICCQDTRCRTVPFDTDRPLTGCCGISTPQPPAFATTVEESGERLIYSPF